MISATITLLTASFEFSGATIVPLHKRTAENEPRDHTQEQTGQHFFRLFFLSHNNGGEVQQNNRGFHAY